MRSRLVFAMLIVSSLASQAQAAFFNTNDTNFYNNFANGATLQNFEITGTLAPFALSSYSGGLDGSTTIPANAQVGGQFSGLHFHSGGGNFRDPVNTPGTPAALLNLGGSLSGDAHSGNIVIGSLDINTETLALNAFVEVVFTQTLQNRVGFWLNPALGRVRLTAFDSELNPLETGIGDAGNFVGIGRDANDIKFISIIGQDRDTGFTIDDLTYGRRGSHNTVPEPGTLWLLGLAGFLAMSARIQTNCRVKMRRFSDVWINDSRSR